MPQQHSHPSPDGAANRPCTVIIPVYNAFAESLACLRSVLGHTPMHHKVLVVDDCSPAGNFVEQIPQGLLDDPRLTVQRNPQNLGFVQTCNLAMRQAAPHDVVLLNSDTEVTQDWLHKLQTAAFSHPSIGTVTPLTNSGTICSVPVFLEDNTLPPGYSLTEFAKLVETVSLRRYPKLPTCVGFCVYIKRAVIDKIGVFDEASFGKGYGEENDFSCRAQAAGFVDILDDATFVYHHGSMSFQARTSQLVAAHLEVLAKKHPNYMPRVNHFVTTNPLRAIHRRIHYAMLRRWGEKSRYSILHILHLPPNTKSRDNRPGGIEYHVADLVRQIPEAAHWSLHPTCGEYRLTAHMPGCDCEFQTPFRSLDIPALLSSDHFNVIHVHQTDGTDNQKLADALHDHGNYFVSLHDFRLCCPRVNLLTPNFEVCDGQACSPQCGQSPTSIATLRSSSQRLLKHAKAVFYFSQSTKERFAAILGEDVPWRLIEHGIEPPTRAAACPEWGIPKPSADNPLRVAFLGGISLSKGARLVEQVTKTTSLPSGVPLQWHLIGLIDGRLPSWVEKHGKYEREALPAIVDRAAPHVAAIVSIWPETYCYTFDEALACRVPVVSTPLGAPAERLERLQCGWTIKSLTPEGILDTLQHIVDHWDDYNTVRRRLDAIPNNDVSVTARRYGEIYCENSKPLGCSIEEQLAAIERLFAKNSGGPKAWLRRAAGHSLNASVATIEAMRLRAIVAGVARRVLPIPVRRRLAELRQHVFWS